MLREEAVRKKRMAFFTILRLYRQLYTRIRVAI